MTTSWSTHKTHRANHGTLATLTSAEKRNGRGTLRLMRGHAGSYLMVDENVRFN
jgi:hypothetical protein